MTECLTIKQFCKDVGIAVRTFYVLRTRGEAPPVVRIGRRVVIRRAAAEAWLAARETAA